MIKAHHEIDFSVNKTLIEIIKKEHLEEFISEVAVQRCS